MEKAFLIREEGTPLQNCLGFLMEHLTRVLFLVQIIEPYLKSHKHIHALTFWSDGNQNRFISNLYGWLKGEDMLLGCSLNQIY